MDQASLPQYKNSGLRLSDLPIHKHSTVPTWSNNLFTLRPLSSSRQSINHQLELQNDEIPAVDSTRDLSTSDHTIYSYQEGRQRKRLSCLWL